MGVLTDYFSAPSDQAAASALDGGPALPFDTFRSKALDPYLIMGRLEAALTGRDFETLTSDPRYARTVAERAAEGPWVFKVSSTLQAALAAADKHKLQQAAVQWSDAEELDAADLESLLGVAEELAGLATRATAKGEHLYCWVSL